MDSNTISIILSISGIVITIVLAIIGYFIGSKTIGSIHARLEAHDKFVNLVQGTQSDLKELAMIAMQIGAHTVKTIDVHSGTWTDEKEEEMKEALQELQQRLNDLKSVLSVENKVEER